MKDFRQVKLLLKEKLLFVIESTGTRENIRELEEARSVMVWRYL